VSDYQIVKDREHRAGVEPTLPRYECGVFAARRPVPVCRKWDQTGSNRHQVRLRARYAAANTLIPQPNQKPAFVFTDPVGTEGIEPSARAL
jgi:hypothetical protein